MKKFLSVIISAALMTVLSVSVNAEEAENDVSLEENTDVEVIEIIDEDSAAAPYAYAQESTPAMAIADEPELFEIIDEEAAASDAPVNTGDNNAIGGVALLMAVAGAVSLTVMPALKRS